MAVYEKAVSKGPLFFFLEYTPMTHHLILGAGPAGVIAAETIRKLAPGDRITIVGDEREPSYCLLYTSPSPRD